MSKFKKFLCSAICLAAIAVGGFASGAPLLKNVVTFLDTYDQLAGLSGSEGFFLVRDASNTRTGQHGDPRVRYGWGMYTWDNGTRGWKIVAKQEVTEASFPDIEKFLTKEAYRTDISPTKQQVISNVAEIASVKADAILLSGRVETAEKKLNIHGTNIQTLLRKAETTEADITRIDADVTSLKESDEAQDAKIADVDARIVSLSNSVATVDGKIDVKEVEIKTFASALVSDAKIDIITNTAKRVRAVLESAKTYTDGQIAVEATRADQSAQSKVDAKANEIMGKVSDKIGDLGGVENVTKLVSLKTQAAIEAAAADATTKADAAKTEAVADAKAAVPGIFDEKIAPVKAELEGEISAVDAKIVATSNALDSAATVKANAAKVEANGYTDGKITNLRSVMTSAGGEAMIFNESDGGGAMMTTSDGMKSYVGVSHNTTSGLAGQLYVVKGVNKTKINMYDGKFCYVKGDNPATDADKDKRELVAKEELDAATEGVRSDVMSALADAFKLPLTFTKGGVKYQLDVVDNGEDDITLKVVRVED